MEALPKLSTQGGTTAVTSTAVVGHPRKARAEQYVPGAEPLETGTLRVTILGSGLPWVTRAQASASLLVEVGNPERDLLLFDVGSGSLANFASLRLPLDHLDKVFLTHLHSDHTSDLITLVGSYQKAGRSGPVRLWGPDGPNPELGTRFFASAIADALTWDRTVTEGYLGDDSGKLIATEFNHRASQVVYEGNSVTVTAFPVIHCMPGAVGYRIDFEGLSVLFSGDTRPVKTLVTAAGDGVDLLVHECFPPAEALAAVLGMDVAMTKPIFAQHTSPRQAGKILAQVRPRVGALWHTPLAPPFVAAIFDDLRKEYDGPIVQTQDLTVFDIDHDAIVARQARVDSSAPAVVAGRGAPPVVTLERAQPPAWWDDIAMPD
jgi:ribonuclease Z